MAKKKWKIYFIPQTHWDKEWYFTKYVSDVFLIDNLEKIYEIYQRDKNELKSFVYDGQVSIVDDYLSYFPENKAKIQELVKAGKLIVGPWYTQTDTTNAMGESIVRNLLIGTKQSEELGGTMHVGYIPDSFGFNANLPQILKKANLKALIHWRGIHQDHLKDGVFNVWEGIDGTKIPIYNLYKWGYGVGTGAGLARFKEKWTLEDMPEQAKIYLENSLKNKIPVLKSVSQNTNGLILMPMGSDQLPVYDGMQQWADELNKIDDEHEWVLANYDEFIDDLLARNDLTKLNQIQGELRFGQYSRVHKTITSSRYDIKKLVRDLEYLIYEETEPLGLLFEKFGGQYPRKIIEKNLKKLLASQAHDSLGGCNTDETNHTIVERLSGALAGLESLNTLMKKRIIEALKLKENELLVFNLKPYVKSKMEKIWVYTQTPSFKIKNKDGELVDFKVLQQKHINIEQFAMIEDTHLKSTKFDIDEKGQFWTEIIFQTGKMAGTSFEKFLVEEERNQFNLLTSPTPVLENEFLKLEINKNGSINLLNKKTKILIDEAFSLVSDFDAGDSYDYSPSKNHPQKTNQLVNFEVQVEKNSQDFSKMKINYAFKVPRCLDSQDLVNQNLTLVIFLSDDQIEFEFILENEVQDIRWRMISKTNIPSQVSYADTSFGIISRPVKLPEMAVWEEQKWHDCPIEIEAIESLVCLKNKESSFAILTKGNNEYQVIGPDYSELALTLFRAYSTIGRREMLYRPGRASGIDAYPHLTPEANQKCKLLKVSFAIVLNSDQNLVRKAKEWATDSIYYQNQNVNQFHWKGDTFVMAKRPLLDPQNFAPLLNFDLPDNFVVSALKKAENDQGIIIRIYNANFENNFFNKPKNFVEVDLMENKISETGTEFGPNEVKTYLLKN